MHTLSYLPTYLPTFIGLDPLQEEVGPPGIIARTLLAPFPQQPLRLVIPTYLPTYLQ